MCKTALFVIVQAHFIAYCRRREAVKLFRFLLSPYRLIESFNNIHSRDEVRRCVNLCIILEDRGYHKVSENLL
jgi:hypothetical protein